jgi:hypothetical protein
MILNLNKALMVFIFRVLFVNLVFIGACILIRYESSVWGEEGYPGIGMRLLLFQSGKIVFSILFFLGAVGFGFLLPRGNLDEIKKFFIQCVAGLALFTIFFSVIGLMGLLKDFVIFPIVLIGLNIFLIKQKFSVKRAFRRKYSPVYFFVFCSIILLAMKGLYPAGGHDYWTHYLPYQLFVSETGSTQPNIWWYHFFVSKGLVILMAPLALSNGNVLVLPILTWAIVLLTAIGIAAFSRKSHPNWFFGAFYLIILSYTPAPIGIYRANGGWGDFGKAHEIAALFVLAIAVTILRQQNSPIKNGTYLGLLLVNSLALSLIAMPALILLTFGLFVYFLFTLKMHHFKVNLYSILTIGVALIFTMFLNLRIIGLASDLLVGKNLINRNLGVLFNPSVADGYGFSVNIWSMASSLSRTVSLQTVYENVISSPKLIFDFYRIEYFVFALGILLLASFFLQFNKEKSQEINLENHAVSTKSLFLILLGTVIFCILTVSDETDKISGYRGLASFLALVCLLFALSLETLKLSIAPMKFSLISLFVVFGMFISVATVWKSSDGVSALSASLKHALGRTSTYQELKLQAGLSGRLPFGAINDDARIVLSDVYSKSWIYSPNLWTYNGLAANKLISPGPASCWMSQLTQITSINLNSRSQVLSYSGPKMILIDTKQPIQQFDNIFLTSEIMSKVGLVAHWKVLKQSNGVFLIKFDPYGSEKRLTSDDVSTIRELLDVKLADSTKGLIADYSDFRKAYGLQDSINQPCPN